MTTVYSHYPCPVGRLLLVGERDPAGRVRLRGAYLPGDRHGPVVDPTWVDDGQAFATVTAELGGYFRGERLTFDLPLEMGGTPFQRRVWAELARIPFGDTVSYGEIAARIGRKGAARAVGAAVAKNPVAIVVPCHRVVGSRGTLTGYAGGLDRKAWLLDHERAVLARTSPSAGRPMAATDPARHRTARSPATATPTAR